MSFSRTTSESGDVYTGKTLEKAKLERTLLLIKPEGIQRGLVGEILGRFEKRGAKISAIKMLFAKKELIEKHYAEHKGKPYYEGLVQYMQTGPTLAAIIDGLDMITVGRVIAGATNPVEAAPGSIRGDFGISINRNLVHTSNSATAAIKEIELWFSEAEHVHWRPIFKSTLFDGDPMKGTSYPTIPHTYE